MIIKCKPEDVTTEGVKLGVKISQDGVWKDAPDGFKDVYEAMEINTIFKCLKDYNEDAFNLAMEHFIEEELKNG